MSYTEQIFDLTGKIVIVTGGNGQLGTEYVKALTACRAKVAIFDIAENLNQEIAGINKDGEIRYYRVDIANPAEVKAALKSVEELWGTPNVLVNNAALDSPPGANPDENRSFEDYPLESWDSVVRVNQTGVFVCCQIIGRAMAENGGGSIINISSTYGLVSPNQGIYRYRAEQGKPFVKPIAYSATKSAILNMSRYLATYWGEKKVRVNTLVPGGIYNGQDETFVNNYSSLVPLKRMADKQEYNGALIFLASDASSYMTGATLVIDGGWTAW